jgi:3-methyladenine DNA glycosylase AlkD
MTSVNEVVKIIKSKAKPENLEGMARYGISTEGRLGLPVPEMRKIAKEIGKDHKLGLELWKTGYAEARIVAGFISEPDKLTEDQMEDWVKDFNSWDVCDQLCSCLFCRSPLGWKKVYDFADRDEEFVRRTSYALIAYLAIHDKKANDRKFIETFPLIKNASTDDRNYVKKAVNWALRNIGKRNSKLNKEAIKLANSIKKIDSKPARWIANDAIRELESEAVQNRLKKKK